MPATRLLDQVRNTARLRHLSLKTEKAYVNQIKRYILLHGKKHPAEMSEDHIRAYLSYLAVERNVAASTQNVALAALPFLYRDVLKQKLDRVEEVERARVSRHMPIVLTRQEVSAVLQNLSGTAYLAGGLINAILLRGITLFVLCGSFRFQTRLHQPVQLSRRAPRERCEFGCHRLKVFHR